MILPATMMNDDSIISKINKNNPTNLVDDEELKFIMECPQLYLADYFSSLKKRIDYQVHLTLFNEANLNNSKNEQIIRKKYADMIEQINKIELECLRSCKQNILKFKSNEMNSTNKSASILTELHDEKLLKLKRMIFLNRNCIFINPICINGPLSDPTNIGKLKIVNKYF
jgi:hypothetical protein